MNKKVIGYQIKNENNEVPNGLFSFQVFRTIGEAYGYCRENNVDVNEFFISQVRENDIEDMSYVYEKPYTLEDILRVYLKCENPFDENMNFTQDGYAAYGTLTDILYAVGRLTERNVEYIVETLDEISNNQF